MTELPICARCGHYVPSDEEPGVGPGVLSMTVTHDSEQLRICMPCGWHEAWQQATGELAAPDAWPLQVPEKFYRGLGSC
ncbi:MAG: hypothetical protein ACR2JS_02085 [Candidatus Nanopelagicales bacterium]